MSKSKLENINWDKIETIHYINKCKVCDSNFLIPVEKEPLTPQYFKNNKKQKCIVECSKCGARYITDYD